MSGSSSVEPQDPAAARMIKAWAQELGFVMTGITATTPPPRYQHFLEWLAAGYQGEMNYLRDRKEAYSHPRFVLDGCHRLILLAMPYSKPPQKMKDASDASANPNQDLTVAPSQFTDHQPFPEHVARLAAYAAGEADYHDVIHERLKRLMDLLAKSFPESQHRGVVDTAPLLEREYASLAGLGWIGKNSLLLTRTHGSYVFLAAILTNQPFPIDAPFISDHCGSCRACLDACPTEAFPQPYVLDATRCISYLTIEHRGPIADELKAKMDGWLFGCDVCQQVCPWNRRPIPEVDPRLAAQPDEMEMALLDILTMTPESFRKHFRRRPQWRAKYEGMLRNAAIAAGNQRMQAAIPELQRLSKSEWLGLRDAANWALAQMDTNSNSERTN